MLFNERIKKNNKMYEKNFELAKTPNSNIKKQRIFLPELVFFKDCLLVY